MHKIALSNSQLDKLAASEDCLTKYYQGAIPCDKLPTNSERVKPRAYILNTDPEGQTGTHWISIRTKDNVVYP